jgi:hypothetical protein
MPSSYCWSDGGCGSGGCGGKDRRTGRMSSMVALSRSAVALKKTKHPQAPSFLQQLLACALFCLRSVLAGGRREQALYSLMGDTGRLISEVECNSIIAWFAC